MEIIIRIKSAAAPLVASSIIVPFFSNKYIVTNNGTTSTIYLYKIIGVTAQLISSFAAINGSWFIQQGLFVDVVNNKLIVLAVQRDGTKRAWWTDSTLSTFTEDGTIVANMNANNLYSCRMIQDFSGLTPKPILLRVFEGSPGPSAEIYEYDSATSSFSLKTSGFKEMSGTFINYGSGLSFTGIKDKKLNLQGNRYQFDIQAYDKFGASLSITPQFSTDSGYTYSNMTIDESTTGYTTALPSVTIGSDTNSFNDDFSSDRVTNSDGYAIRNIGSNSQVIVDTTQNVLRLLTGSGESIVLLRRLLLLNGDFELKIGFNGIGSNLTTSPDTVRVGLRLRVLGDSSTNKFFSDTNYVEMYVLKDSVNAGVYEENQVVNGVSTITTGGNAPVSGEDPALHIRRVTGLLSGGYGSTVTWLSSSGPLTYLDEMLLEIFVETTGSASQNVSLSFYK